MSCGPKSEKRPADVIVHRVKTAWFALSLGPFCALGEGQKPESACGHARDRRGLGTLNNR
jgi:hypothetical protein